MYREWLIIGSHPSGDTKVWWEDSEVEALKSIKELKKKGYEIEAYNVKINKVYQIDGFYFV